MNRRSFLKIAGLLLSMLPFVRRPQPVAASPHFPYGRVQIWSGGRKLVDYGPPWPMRRVHIERRSSPHSYNYWSQDLPPGQDCRLDIMPCDYPLVRATFQGDYQDVILDYKAT